MWLTWKNEDLENILKAFRFLKNQHMEERMHLFYFNSGNRIRTSDWQQKIDWGRFEMNVKRSSNQDVCGTKASLSARRMRKQSLHCREGASAVPGFPFQWGSPDSITLPARWPWANRFPFWVSLSSGQKAGWWLRRLDMLGVRYSQITFSYVMHHFPKQTFSKEWSAIVRTRPSCDSDWYVFDRPVVPSAAQPWTLHCTRRRKKNTSLRATLQTKARFTHNCSGTDVVQDGLGELTKTNQGKTWAALWWRNQEEMKSARVPACLFQSWQGIDLTGRSSWFIKYFYFITYFTLYWRLCSLSQKNKQQSHKSLWSR